MNNLYLKTNLLRVILLSLLVAIVLPAVFSHRLMRSAFAGPLANESNLSMPEQSIATGIVESYGRLPLIFEANEGQTDEQVKFLSRGPGYDLFLTAAGAVLRLRDPR